MGYWCILGNLSSLMKKLSRYDIYIGNNCKVHCIERFKSYYFYVKYNNISFIKSYCKLANECIFLYFPNIFCEAF